MKKILVSIIISLLMIAVILSAGCTGENQPTEEKITASYTEANFNFVGSWINIISDAAKVGFVLNADGTGTFLTETSDLGLSMFKITRTEHKLESGVKYSKIYMNGEDTGMSLLATSNDNQMLLFLTLKSIEEWTPITLTRVNEDEIQNINTPTAIPTSTQPKITTAQANAVKKAKSYISHSAFSYNGLIEQLEYEGYSYDDSVYGANNCGADWYEEAVQKARSYLSHSSFSRDGLYDQLEYEGYTHDQIEYALKIVYDN